MGTTEKKYYCPTCGGELEMLSGCGAVGYFCNHCRKLVSRQKMLSEAPGAEAAAVHKSKNDGENETEQNN
jgi:tRNA(Ile2) C34 agmatinyltransferase TiaS